MLKPDDYIERVKVTAEELSGIIHTYIQGSDLRYITEELNFVGVNYNDSDDCGLRP